MTLVLPSTWGRHLTSIPQAPSGKTNAEIKSTAYLFLVHCLNPVGGCQVAVWCSVTQSCPILCNPMNYSPPGSSVHGDSPGNTGVG